MLLVEVDELLPDIHATCDGIIMQDLVVARGELMERMLLVGEGSCKLLQPPRIALKILLVLRIDSSQFAIKRLLIEDGANEEFGKDIQSTVEWRLVLRYGKTALAGVGGGAGAVGGGGCGELEVEVGVYAGGEGIGVPTILCQVRGIGVLFREL